MTQDEMIKEIEFLKDVTKRQLAIITALNDIVGGEMNGGTTSNILNYSRWETRLVEAVKEEREACAKTCIELAAEYRTAGHPNNEIAATAASIAASRISARGVA